MTAPRTKADRTLRDLHANLTPALAKWKNGREDADAWLICERILQRPANCLADLYVKLVAADARINMGDEADWLWRDVIAADIRRLAGKAVQS